MTNSCRGRFLKLIVVFAVFVAAILGWFAGRNKFLLWKAREIANQGVYSEAHVEASRIWGVFGDDSAAMDLRDACRHAELGWHEWIFAGEIRGLKSGEPRLKSTGKHRASAEAFNRASFHFARATENARGQFKQLDESA